MLIIFVGDTGQHTAEYTRSLFPQARLISENTSAQSGIYYTSLGDFKNQKNFFDLLNQATELYYVASASWSDNQMQQSTEDYLMFFYGRKPVHGLEHLCYHNACCDSLVAHRIGPEAQLWIAGGTVTFSSELPIEAKWGSVLGTLTNMPVAFVTQQNANIDWCADQLLRSDIRSGDCIVWELDHTNDIDKSLQLIQQCVQVFNNMQVRLIFVGLNGMEKIKYFFNLPNYLHLYGQFGTFFAAFPDKDSTTLLPGPVTHKWYANEIHKKFFL